MPTATYPTSPVFSFPVERTLEFDTRILTGDDGTEQRWMIHAGRESWALNYGRLKVSERDTLIAFFEDRKGSALTFDFAFAGTTYSGCYFDADEFEATEAEQGVVTARVKICQVTRSPDSGTLTAFPTLTSGNRVQLPYTHGRSYDTVEARTEGGRYTYSKRTASLRKWTAGGSVLTATDAGAIWDHFRYAAGRYRSFSFTDPDSGVAATSCRYGSDLLTWRYVDAGQHAIAVQIQELI